MQPCYNSLSTAVHELVNSCLHPSGVMNSFSVTATCTSIFLGSFGCFPCANMTGCCSLCSSRGVGRSLRCASSLFNTVSQVKRSSPLPAQRTLQPVSLYAVFILQNHCAVPPAARVVWARWPSLLLSWKRSEVIPVNSLEISNPLIKETGVQVFPVASVYYTKPLLPYSCTC